MATKTSAVQFNGTSRYAKLSTNASIKNMGSFSWMAWIKVGPLATSQYQRVYVERQGTGAGIRFALAAWKGKLRFELGPTDGSGDTNYDFNYTWDDRWHHVAFVGRISGGTPTYEMYLDSNQIAKGTLVRGSGVTAVSNTAPLGSVYVGNYSLHTSGGEVFASDRYWDGKISDILLFNEAKNQSDILLYYASNDIWDMTDTAMFSYWRLDENTGTTTTDADNSGWTGTLYQSGIASSALWTTDRPYIGNGASDTTVPTTPTLPGTPTTLITNDGFTADWNSTTDNVYVQFYELHVATVSDFSAYTTYETSNLVTIKKVTGLLPGTNYYWRVSALDAENNRSAYTATQSLTTTGTGDLVAPLPPTSLLASNLAYNGFRVSYLPSASSDETGYKADVATDPLFTTYLTGYRNKDVGNVTFFDVVGTSPLTTYYVRLRAYDVAENESVESATLVVQTLTIPDVSPPLVVEHLDATSITSTEFTANWLEGVDDIGVAYYVMDISKFSDFSVPLVIGPTTWTAVNVGNVTSYRLTGLTRETTYYYRVRAVDGAGNIGANATSPVSVITASSTIDEGGYIQTTYNPTGDAYTNSAATTTNFGTANPLQVQGSGAAVTLAAHLQFNLTYMTGTLKSAMLRLYVQNASAGVINVNVDNVTFDELTITHANAPTVAGSTLTFTPIVVGQYVEIDLGSLFIDGPTVYDVRIWTNSTDNFTFDSREGTNPPELVVESDPTSATMIGPDFVFHDHAGQVTNYITNPSGEDSTTTKWSATGTTPATVTNTNLDAWDGLRSFRIAANGAAVDQGMEYAKTEIVAALGQPWSVKIAAKSVTGSLAPRLRLVEYTAAGAFLAETVVTMALSTTEWRLYTITRVLTNASTARVGVWIAAPNSTAADFLVDAIILTKQQHEPVYFDGDTSGASWTGTVKASTSLMNMAELHADTSYVGDADGDNTVRGFFKRSTEAEWIHLPAMVTDMTNNRGTKQAIFLVGPSYGSYNAMRNPGFEVDTFGWSLFNPNANASMARTTEEAYRGVGSLLLTVGVGAGSAVVSHGSPTVPGDIWNSRVRLMVPTGMTARLAIRALNSAGAFISESTPVVGISDVVGNDLWQEATQIFTMPALAAFVDIAISITSAVAGAILIDNAFLNKSNYAINNPYRDGTDDDAAWGGSNNYSTTGLILLPETSYDFRHDYTDPDGIVDNDTALTVRVTGTHVTANIADNVTTAESLTLTGTTDSIGYEIHYDGDDDNDMTVIVEYKRTDLSTWTSVIPTYERPDKQIRGDIPNLKPGTSYTIRVTFTDPDGVYGTNPMTSVLTTTTDFDSPDAQSTIMFGGFVLMGRPDGKIGVNEHDAFGFPERRLQVEALPRVDGAIEISNLWGKRSISMTGFVSGESRGELEDNKNALKRALAPNLQRLVIDTLSNQGRYYYATCESLGISEVGGESIRHLMWDAEFTCADPFAYESASTRLPEFTVTNNATASAVNSGDLRIDPEFKIRTTHTSPVTLTILNQTTGERITPATTMVNGDRIIIDTAKLSVLKNGVDIDYAGGFPHLTTGTNVFKFTLSATVGTPSALVEITWRHKFL